MLSVIICSHNPRADYLRRTLEALKSQSLDKDYWELLLVDNGSKEKLESCWNLGWHPHSRHVRENQLGLTAARLRGIRESQGELMVFVDDDNLLFPDYLETVLKIQAGYRHIAVFGAGVLQPEFETTPAKQFKDLLPQLAVRTIEGELWTNNWEDWHSTPWGAGLCVIRPMAEYYALVVQRLSMGAASGAQGDQLFRGEDDLFSWAAVRLGFGFGIFSSLKITHLISSKRLTEDYFLRLISDHAFSHGLLRFLLYGREPRRVDMFKIGSLALHGIRNGFFSMRCQYAAAKGDMASLRAVQAQNLKSVGYPSVTEGDTRAWAVEQTSTMSR